MHTFTHNGKTFQVIVQTGARMAIIRHEGRLIDQVSVYQLTVQGETNWARGALNNDKLQALRSKT